MEKLSSIKNRKCVIYAKKDLVLVMITKIIIKSEIIVNTQENIEELLMVFVIQDIKHPKKVPIAFHNGSTYDYHFIIKELAKEFEGLFEYLAENT